MIDTKIPSNYENIQSNNTIGKILAGGFFSDIEDSWKTNDPVNRCHDSCGKMITDKTKILESWPHGKKT